MLFHAPHALTPFCNHVILHLAIHIIHELASREKGERLVSSLWVLHLHLKWSWADIISSIRMSFCTIWVVRGIIPALSIDLGRLIFLEEEEEGEATIKCVTYSVLKLMLMVVMR